MFAFVLWDRKQQTFFMARLGVKPLFYSLLDDGTPRFGSELKVLTAHPGFKRAIDPLAISTCPGQGLFRAVFIDGYSTSSAHADR